MHINLTMDATHVWQNQLRALNTKFANHGAFFEEGFEDILIAAIIIGALLASGVLDMSIYSGLFENFNNAMAAGSIFFNSLSSIQINSIYY